jgi:hypothetical protein
VLRNLVILFLSAAFVAGASGQRGTLDPAFEKVPFDSWLTESEQTRFHWTASVPRAELSFHQRLIAPIEITLDGRELASRRGNGTMVFLIQIMDSEGARYQNHNSMDLSKLDENVKTANVELSQHAFFLPGDYRLAVGIFDTATGEHSTIQTQFRVAPTRQAFLEKAWRNLPAVEFVDNHESPDSWYLPDIHGRLEWATSVSANRRLNVLLNVVTSVDRPGSRATPSSGLTALLPTLKAISQTGSSSITEDVELLDLSRRRAIFHQEDVRDLDWSGLRTSLGDASTASIDVHSLSERHHDAQFFVSEVRKLLRASGQPSVLVVLTTAAAFESGEDLSPISLEALPACRVIYIRYRSPIQATAPFGQPMGGRGRGMGMGGRMNRTTLSREVIDQLEGTLKPLGPKVFDVRTPEEMTKAMAEAEKALLTFDSQTTR